MLVETVDCELLLPFAIFVVDVSVGDVEGDLPKIKAVVFGNVLEQEPGHDEVLTQNLPDITASHGDSDIQRAIEIAREVITQDARRIVWIPRIPEDRSSCVGVFVEVFSESRKVPACAVRPGIFAERPKPKAFVGTRMGEILVPSSTF